MVLEPSSDIPTGVEVIEVRRVDVKQSQFQAFPAYLIRLSY